MWNLRVWGSDVRRFCHTLAIGDPVVFGHSFGAAGGICPRPAPSPG